MTSLWKVCMASAAAVMLSVTASVSAETRVQGSGATFPAPLYAKWAQTYNNAHPEVKVDYSAIGSGGGIKAITDKVVQFAGSDAPMTKDQEAKAPGIMHLPTVAGPVVLTYNLPGLSGDIKLDGEAVANIYLAKITKWNDAKLVALNPGMNLPDLPIVSVHRSDNSGTTFIFTNYLSKVSPEWKESVGNATGVQWPGNGLGGKGNPGVAAAVKTTVGGLGYVELAFAVQNKLPYATQINKDGKEVRASIAGVESAIANSITNFPADLKVSITDAPGAESYPICGFTYFLVYNDLSFMKDKSLAQDTADFIQWCETEGQNSANELGYAKLPKEAQDKVLEKIKSIKFEGEALVK